MTRRQGLILGLIRREPMTTFALARALDCRIADAATDLNKLTAAGVINHTEDGWALTDPAGHEVNRKIDEIAGAA